VRSSGSVQRLRPQKGGGVRVRPEINITPLVDVVLVLLIIFMVIQNELEHGTRVEMPGVSNADKAREADPDDITVTVAADGSMFIQDEKIRHEELVPRLKKLKDAKPFRRVMLKGDKSQAYGDMRRVFKEIADAGWVGVKLLVGTRADSRAAREN